MDLFIFKLPASICLPLILCIQICDRKNIAELTPSRVVLLHTVANSNPQLASEPHHRRVHGEFPLTEAGFAWFSHISS